MKDTWKIVLIDDEEDIRDVVALTLEDRGYAVATAGDGQAGLALVATFAPRIVITDIRMPKMDGLQVLAAVKAAHPTIEVIVITAFGEMDLAIAALQGDASDFITKPINDTALHLALDRACSRYTARKQVADYLRLLETQNARTAKELETAIGLQRNLIESSMDGIMCCGRAGEVLLVNRAMEHLLGLTRDAVVGKMQLDGFFETDTARRFHKDLEGKKHGGPGRLFVYETALKCRDGTTLPVEVSAVGAEGSAGDTGLVCFFRDIRKVRELEREMQDQAQILHQDKMMSLGRLAASVVHEINNPLSGILNYIRLMAKVLGRGPLDPPHQEKFAHYIDAVEKETERVSRIVSSLLAFSRKSPPSFGQVAVDELLRRCLGLSRHKLELQNIAVKEAIPATLSPVKGDFNQLQQCVINLIFNAIDAMPAGGTLSLSARQEQGQVALTVADTGCGIAPQDLARIFEPFFTTKSEGYGVGLGLSTTYGIIERHGGRIDVHSELGKETAVTLVLPVMGIRDGQ